MRIIVRYWVGLPPVSREAGAGGGEWLDHSDHPPSKLGLHNAVLAAEDRWNVLRRLHGRTPHGCDIFIEAAGKVVAMNVAEAERLLGMLDQGGLSWEALESLLERDVTGSAGAVSLASPEPPRVEAPPAPLHSREVAEYAAAEERHRIDFDA